MIHPSLDSGGTHAKRRAEPEDEGAADGSSERHTTQGSDRGPEYPAGRAGAGFKPAHGAEVRGTLGAHGAALHAPSPPGIARRRGKTLSPIGLPLPKPL